MNDRKRRAIAGSLAAWIFAASAPCAAGGADAAAKSRAIFEEADDLAGHGKLAEACPLFKAAHEINATSGTAFRTADCYEKLGKLDLALAHYQYVVDHSASDKQQERVARAEARVAALKKQLGVGQTAPLPIPDAPPPPPPLVPNRLPAFIALGVGGAGAVLGGVFGGLALAQASDVKSRCGGAPPCAPRAPDTLAGLQQQANAAGTKAWVANVGIGLAVAGVATGVALYVLKWPKAQQVVKGATSAEGLTLHF
jgi:tetratricopeptide (TPR) repeat protein